MNTELKILFENSWKLNKEQIQLKKTYHFKIYIKVAISKSLDYHDKADISGFASYNCNKKQIGKSSFNNENYKNHLSLYFNSTLDNIYFLQTL